MPRGLGSGPPPPKQEHETCDLLDLSTRALAAAVAELPDLYSAQLLQDTLPAPLKPRVAGHFIGLVSAQVIAALARERGAGGEAGRLSRGEREHWPT